MVCDLANKIATSDEWDPTRLFNPIQKEIPETRYEDPQEPIAKAERMAVDIPTSSLGRTDSFIDDLMNVF